MFGCFLAGRRVALHPNPNPNPNPSLQAGVWPSTSAPAATKRSKPSEPFRNAVGAKRVRDCSKACQKADWKAHTATCKAAR